MDLFFSDIIRFVLPIVIVNSIIALINFPITKFFFHKTSNNVAIYAFPVGLMLTAYTQFFLVFLGQSLLGDQIVKFDGYSLALSLIILITLNLILYIRVKVLKNILNDAKYLIRPGIVIFILTCLMTFIKGFNPELYGIERFLDFGIIQAILASKTIPPQDFWMAGNTINYYYFGFLTPAQLTLLSHVNLAQGFYAISSLYFALITVLTFKVGCDLWALKYPSKDSTLKVLAGIISTILVNFAAPIVTVNQILNSLIVGSEANFWYSDASRITPGAITEFPLYSFLVADLHAHILVLPAFLIALVCIISISSQDTPISIYNKYIWLLSFSFASVALTNPWDSIFLALLIGLVFLIKTIRSETNTYSKVFFTGTVMVSVVGILCLPWLLTYNAPISGLGKVHTNTSAIELLIFWGVFIYIIGLKLLWETGNKFITNPKFLFSVSINKLPEQISRVTKLLCSPETLFTLVAVIMIIFTEKYYFRDILDANQWYRANTVFKVWHKVWVVVGISCGIYFTQTLLTVTKLLDTHPRITQQILIRILAASLYIIPAGALVYAPFAINQAYFSNKDYKGLTKSLDFWKNKFPNAFNQYEYLRRLSYEKLPTLVEAEGESYKDYNYFSVFLGWPTIIGWPVHEWTHRGDFKPIGLKQGDVYTLYTAQDSKMKKAVIDKYGIDYIIVSEIEYLRYGDMVFDKKIKDLGAVIYQSNEYYIVKVAQERQN